MNIPLTSRRPGRLRELALALGQRLVFGILILVIIIFLSHLGLEMAQSPLENLLASLSQAAERTLGTLGRLLRGDLGLTESATITLRQLPIREVLVDRFTKSFVLLGVALLVATIVGVSLGIWTATRRPGISLPFLLVSIAGISVPSFFAALLLQLGAIQLTRTLGRTVLPVGGYGLDAHLLLPALVLAARPVAQIARVTYVTVQEILQEDFVRTARSKGLWPKTVLYRHVFRNAAVPVLTTVGVSLRYALSTLPVVEFFFGWPGVGFTLLKSISQRDHNLTVALVVSLGALFVLVNLLLEFSYRVIDPRLRKTPAHITQAGRTTPREWFRSLAAELRDWALSFVPDRWRRSEGEPSEQSPFQRVLASRQDLQEESGLDIRVGERRAWVKGTLGNVALVLGTFTLAGLLVAIVFNTRLAPHSPYTTRGLSFVDGEFIVPPFAPDEAFAWGTDVLGRDLMSLILAGAQQTLILTTLVTLARMVVGFFLGTIAGWFSGAWIDRLILGLAEVIAAFPTLLLAMILILALGIREGMPPFIIALCFVGWGEIMQFVRGEVISIRPRLFIESAMALGMRTPRIILRHMLPNMAPVLISIAALEMGAVLMLLGELGFLGIFIGGGAFAQLGWQAPLFHYSDVPEWGALLSNMRTYARSYPWTALYPSLAFFIAILGFNLFGEGLRRLVEVVGVRVVRVFNRYTIALGVAAVAGVLWVQGATGALAVYRDQAAAFDGQDALATLHTLTDARVEGRGLGTTGMDAAARYIASEFEAMGIQAAGEQFTYFQPRPRSYEVLAEPPALRVEDGGPPLTYRVDFAEYPSDYRNLGQASGPVRVLAMGELTGSGTWHRDFIALRELDYANEIVMALSPQDAARLDEVARGGMLVVSEDPDQLARRHTLSSDNAPSRRHGNRWVWGVDSPTLWISEATANRLLSSTDHTVKSLRQLEESLGQDEVFELRLDTTVDVQVEGQVRDREQVQHVIGHWPGTSSTQFNEYGLDDRLVVVLAQYDSPPPVPGEDPYPAAVDNASGVAILLEALRTMKETGYQPYRTFLLVAYSGEGREGGERIDASNVDQFLQTKFGFATAYEIEAVVELRGLGGAAGDELMVTASGSLRLADLFESAARRMRVPARRSGENLDISVVFQDEGLDQEGKKAPYVHLSWEGWREASRTVEDAPAVVSAQHLEQSGEAISLGLMILGRETDY